VNRRIALLGLGLVALLSVFSLPAIRARAAEEVDIEKMIQAAKTPADHQAIADYYQHQADAAKAKAAEHTKMAQQYKTGAFGLKTHFHEHCETLAKLYQSEAKEYAALAEAHRQMAAKAK
jgi:hypothetical protein